MANQLKLIAITGGSGAGKTWLAGKLKDALAPNATCLSLDDFYLDRSNLTPKARMAINFDSPDAIDWPLFRAMLDDCRQGRVARIPSYDFTTHTRLPFVKSLVPTPVILVEGLWLLWQSQYCESFDLKIFLDCPVDLRLERRLARDTVERGRARESVCSQFWDTVAPMHEEFVAPQAAWADLVMQAPLRETQVAQLAEMIGSNCISSIDTSSSTYGLTSTT